MENPQDIIKAYVNSLLESKDDILQDLFDGDIVGSSNNLEGRIMAEQYVWVSRDKSCYPRGKVLFQDLKDVHWDNITGGVKKSTGSQQNLFGYILCDKIVEGEVSHSCMHGSAPHSIKVYIPIKYNDKEIIKALRNIADKKGKRCLGKQEIPIADRVREIVLKNPGITPAEIYHTFGCKSISDEEIKRAIHYLKKNKFKTKQSLVSERYRNTQKLYIKE